MSLTGIGCEVRTRGGSFSGKKVCLRFWVSDSQRDFSEPLGRSRFSSGSGSAGWVGLKSKVAIYVTRVLWFRASFLAPPLTDEHTDHQVAHVGFRCVHSVKVPKENCTPLVRGRSGFGLQAFGFSLRRRGLSVRCPIRAKRQQVPLRLRRVGMTSLFFGEGTIT